MKVTRIEPVRKCFVRVEQSKMVLVDYATGEETSFDDPEKGWKEKEKRELDILV